NLTSTAEVIKDMGFQFDFISSEQLATGPPDGYTILILPDALAMSDAEIAAADAFAGGGGFVVNFGASAAFTEHGKPREGTDVEALRWQDRAEPLDPSTLESAVTRTEVGEGMRIDCDFLLDEYRQFQPSGVAGETVERFSANEETAEAWRRMLPGVGIVSIPPALVETAEGELMDYVEVVGFRRKAITYIGVLPRYFGGRYSRGGDVMTVDDEDFVPAVITLTDPRSFVNQWPVYDVRAQKYLGRVRQFETTLAPGIARLYALVPYRVTGITIDCPERAEAGGMLTARCDLTVSDGTPADHVVRWTLTQDGEVLPPYARNALAEAGSGEASFRLPLDMSGEWTLTATDVISGEATTRAVTIEAPER
ncbi:MAG: hypothetical protein ACOCX2_09280, partial [Armatimonadota bacterium]